ncbi:MAG: copper homeostasis protein CutC [Flavobacteriaceae bacterium]|nr:copper homeostasis protein CutC [Flavobacteriaceae bacterium]
MLLEICANSYQSAINAEKAGANRIELCSELSVGGITPSYGVLKKVTQQLTIPVHVLLRPRSGDFTYTNEEFEIMKENIRICKELGVAGIVSGILHKDNTIDYKRTQALVELSGSLHFAFHRGFDCIPNPKEALQNLIALGVQTILTSGQQPKAENGILLLQELQELAGNKLTILAGGGINPNNVGLFKKAGLKAVHASASIVTQRNDSDTYFGKTPQTVSDIPTIQQLIKSIQNA